MRSLGAVAVAVVAMAAAGTAQAGDHAQPRGGGASSSSAGSSHHSSDSGSGGTHSSSSSGSGSSSSDSGSRVSSGAQDRHPRAGTGTGWRGHRGGGYFYSPYWGGYSGYYGYGYGFGYGWSPYYSGGYYGYGYAPYARRYGYDGAGSVRVLVEPNDTRVYVDGYYAGVADDFDGIFQRLRIAPGRHEIALKLDGYRSQTMKVYVPYDQTVKLHYKMVRGTGEDVSQTLGNPEDIARYEADRARAPRRDEAEEEEADDDAGYNSRDRDRDRAADQNLERGLLHLDVRPADASVYVDGTFRGTGRELRQLRLTPGKHRLEVVRPGYHTIDRELDVRSGEEADVDIDLDRS